MQLTSQHIRIHRDTLQQRLDAVRQRLDEGKPSDTYERGSLFGEQAGLELGITQFNSMLYCLENEFPGITAVPTGNLVVADDRSFIGLRPE